MIAVRWPVLLWTCCVLVGGSLLYLPLHTHRDLERWAAELRRTGVPAQAYVFDRITRDGRTTMYLRFAAGGLVREEAIGCEPVCLEAGATPRIWYDPADPGDFVTDFGRLSGDRGDVQGVLGVVGFFVTLAGVGMIAIRIDTAARFRRLVVLVGRDGTFTDGRPHRWAGSGAEAIALFEELRGRRVHELWLDPGETSRPFVEWLQDQAYAGPRPDIERIIVDPAATGATATVRALEHWAYKVETRPTTELVR